MVVEVLLATDVIPVSAFRAGPVPVLPSVIADCFLAPVDLPLPLTCLLPLGLEKLVCSLLLFDLGCVACGCGCG